MPDAVRGWYDAHAHRYDRQHPGVPGDRTFYASLAHGLRVLEIGAGTGRVTAALVGTAAAVVALDPSPAMLGRAAARLARVAGVALVRADGRNLPFNAAFDLVVLPYRVLHHFATPGERARLWREVQQVLVPDGRIAFDTWHGWFASPGLGGPPMTPLKEATIRAELAEAGFQVDGVAAAFDADLPQPEGAVRVWQAVAVPCRKVGST